MAVQEQRLLVELLLTRSYCTFTLSSAFDRASFTDYRQLEFLDPPDLRISNLPPFPQRVENI
jgi:hypothetical protein